MRIVIATALAAGLTLAGCSQKTQESAATAAKDAVSDTASNLDVASSAVSHAADKIDNDVDRATSTDVARSTAGGTTTTTTTTTKTD